MAIPRINVAYNQYGRKATKRSRDILRAPFYIDFVLDTEHSTSFQASACANIKSDKGESYESS